jgi:hypothetical protein
MPYNREALPIYTDFLAKVCKKMSHLANKICIYAVEEEIWGGE